MTLLRPEIAALEPSGIARVAVPRLGDPQVIPLWFGEGDRPTPRFICEAAKAALDEGDTFYSFTRGTVELRAAIIDYLERVYGVELDPDRVTVPGAAMLCVTMAAQMVLRPGDHALAVAPYWPNIAVAIGITGAQLSQVAQRQTDAGWRLTAAEIIGAARDSTRLIYVNSPCNPTGWVMPREEQAELLAFCREREILLLADEVYHRMYYAADAAPSFLELALPDDPLLVVFGLSKSWAMTGWRLGWVVAPPQWVSRWQILSENFNTGATVFTQRAAAVALREGEPLVRELRDHYAAGRDIVMEILGGHPRVELTEPEGAFYAFPHLADIGSSLEFALGLLEKENVGVAPGYTFGAGGEHNVRICFARDQSQLREGLSRLLRFLDRYPTANAN